MNQASSEVAALTHDLAEERRIRRALVESSVQLNSTFNLPDLLRAIIGAAADILGAEAASLLLYDESKHELSFEVATGDSEGKIKTMSMPADTGVAGWVLKNNKPTIVDEAHTDPRFSDAIDRSLGFVTRSLLAVPLGVRDRVIGVVEMINKKAGTGFTERDLDVATAFAAQAAVAIDNAHLYKKLADTVVESRMSYRL